MNGIKVTIPQLGHPVKSVEFLSFVCLLILSSEAGEGIWGMALRRGDQGCAALPLDLGLSFVDFQGKDLPFFPDPDYPAEISLSQK